jgi:hypothetical protein
VHLFRARLLFAAQSAKLETASRGRDSKAERLREGLANAEQNKEMGTTRV